MLAARTSPLRNWPPQGLMDLQLLHISFFRRIFRKLKVSDCDSDFGDEMRRILFLQIFVLSAHWTKVVTYLIQKATSFCSIHFYIVIFSFYTASCYILYPISSYLFNYHARSVWLVSLSGISSLNFQISSIFLLHS